MTHTILTKEAIDILCPKHGRTSCSDDDLANSYGGWSGRYDPDTGKKSIIWPRCTRCYLLNHIGEDVSKLEFRPDVCLELVEENVQKK